MKYCIFRELCVEVYCLISYWRTRSTTLKSSLCRWGSVGSRRRGRRRSSWWISRCRCPGSRSRTPTTRISPGGRSKILLLRKGWGAGVHIIPFPFPIPNGIGVKSTFSSMKIKFLCHCEFWYGYCGCVLHFRTRNVYVQNFGVLKDVNISNQYKR